jgi:ribosomal protein S12
MQGCLSNGPLKKREYLEHSSKAASLGCQSKKRGVIVHCCTMTPRLSESE